jgi:hypothetical protein
MGRRGRKCIDPETVSEILVLLKTNPDRPLASIAQDAGVDPKSVKKIKIKHDEELNGPFFSQRLKDVSHEVLMRICQDPSYDPAPETTKLRDDHNLPEISKHLLDMHRVREYSSDSQQSVVRQYKDGGENFQGFWLYSPHESFNADAVKITTDFVKQIEEDAPVMALFTSIFEYCQDVSHSPATRAANLSLEDLRMGDNGRKHLVWGKWLAELTKLRQERKAKVSSLDRELQSVEAQLAKFAAANTVLDRATRRTGNFSAANTAKAEAAQARFDNLKRQMAEAEKVLATAEAYHQQTLKIEKLMCDNYARIILHSPYEGIVDRAVTDKDLLSLILALPDANSQTMHGDSLQLGGSLLMALREKQYLIILLNGYRAMRSLDRMLAKRTEALNYVHDRIAAHAPEGWIARNWNAKAEHRVWNYLCCLQFEHEGIGAITAVRVPIEVGETLVVDNRTLHGGSRGMKGRNGFRFHTYGYDRDLRSKREAGELDADFLITIDPLNPKHGFYPVCRWAQRSSPRLTPVFRV